MRKLIGLVLAVVMMAGVLPVLEGGLEVEASTPNTSWYNETATTFTLTTEAQLRGLAQLVNGGNGFLGKTILLGNDINLTTEWTPIGIWIGGISDFNLFSGTFNGQGYSINNVHVLENDNWVYAGLFGITFEATIKNVVVNVGSQGVKALAIGSVIASAGGLIGWAMETTVENCYVTGGNISSDSNSDSDAGGLIGQSSSTTVLNCYATNNVSAFGRGSSAGGLIGSFFSSNGVTISNSYATGNVNAAVVETNIATHANAGGLIGYAGDVTIMNCYAMGDITAVAATTAPFSGTNAGGLIGRTGWRVNISNCYAVGYNVDAFGAFSGTGIYRAGGLIGHRITTEITILDSYRLVGAPLTITGSEIEESGTPLTNAQMKTQSSFVGWNFTTIWDINPNTNNGYPFLRVFYDDSIDESPSSQPTITPSDGIDYTAPNIVIIGKTGNANSEVIINLTAETIVFGEFKAVAFSIDGGNRWRAVKPNIFSASKFPNLLNRDLNLRLSNTAIDRKTRKPPTDAVIVEFPNITKRPKIRNFIINYAIGVDKTGKTPGEWVLTERNSHSSVKSGIEVAVANGRIPNTDGYGRFIGANGTSNGIAVMPISGTRVIRTNYFIREAPKLENGTYIAASRPRRITVAGQRRAPIHKRAKNGNINFKAGTFIQIGSSAPVFRDTKGILMSVTYGNNPVAFWLAPTANRSASAKQILR
jgi:hypothetical protein